MDREVYRRIKSSYRRIRSSCKMIKSSYKRIKSSYRGLGICASSRKRSKTEEEDREARK